MKLTLALKLLVGLLIVFSGRISVVMASPWVEADDTFLRASIEQLVDAGYLQGHRTTYPLMWSGIARDLSEIDVSRLSEEHKFAFYRVRAALEFSQRPVTRVLRTSLDTESEPGDMHHNSFANTSHERAAVTSATSFTGEYWAGRLQTTFRASAADDKRYHFSGSYLATTIGNWALSADQMPVWWGPSHENALVLSTNSLPIQAFRVNRLRDDPLPLLGWLGHVHTTGFVGRTQSSATLGDNYVGGARATVRPVRHLEVGASYVGHWESFGDFYNQIAGLDARLSFAGRFGVYGEVASNNSGSDDLAYTLGIDTHWAANRTRLWRIYSEYSEVPALFYDRSVFTGEPIEPSGYRRWGYAIGAGQDQDVDVVSVGLMTQSETGAGWSLRARLAEYGDTNLPMNLRVGFDTFSTVETYQVDVKHFYPINDSLITLGVGYRQDRVSASSAVDSGDSSNSSEFSFNAQWEFRF